MGDGATPGAGVRLRPVTEEDLATLEALTNTPEGAGEHEWFGWSDPSLYHHRWAENGLLGSYGGTLIVAERGAVAGFVNWRQVVATAASHCWEIGIVLDPAARGHGTGTAAQRLLARYLFAHTQVNRVQAVTETVNVAEQRALEKAGFTREGILRGFGWRDGKWRDGVMYSLLRDEADTIGGP